ncbi:hypothetical protein BD289DRAFT_370071 [Coniella lustricola]|uniref:Kelch repeat protein n=1 Tax=Coniella lustricola TaxID=2025994 RepID=A0A2T3A5S9_9PEZI|nr:hypothetical protein BD289DRAFT_370071 [Coniella lustricola]
MVLGHDDARALDARQADGAVSETYFLRRAYHSSTIIGTKLYIDGGLYSYSSGSGVEYQYSDTLLYIDLDNDFTPDTASIESISKPSGAPNLEWGGVWTNDGIMYSGFAGHFPSFGDKAWQDAGLWSFEPNSDGTDGTWTNLNSTATSSISDGPRPYLGSIASGNGTGFFLGGLRDYTANDTSVPTSGLLSYDFASNTVSNTSVTGIASSGFTSHGRMHYVPNFGPAGVFISAGGRYEDLTGETYMQSLATIQIFDPATKTWYEQATTGDTPQTRVEFCMSGAPSTNDTYEIVVYAGWNYTLGDDAIPWDDLYVLSLPAFHWFQASYTALHPRHALTCEHLGGGQILAIGGLDTTQWSADEGFYTPFDTVDTHSQGLAVFDLGSLSWTDAYTANQSVYTQSSTVQSYYADNDRMADFTDSALQALFSVQNFTAAATSADGDGSATGSSDGAGASGTAASGSGSGVASGSSSGTTSVGAIAGGVVGGVVAVAIVGVVLFFVRKKSVASKRLQERNARESSHLSGSTAPSPGGMMEGAGGAGAAISSGGGGAYGDARFKGPYYEMSDKNVDAFGGRVEAPDNKELGTVGRVEAPLEAHARQHHVPLVEADGGRFRAELP